MSQPRRPQGAFVVSGDVQRQQPSRTTRRCSILCWGSFSGIIVAMPIRSSNAYYAADIAALVSASPAEVIGALVTNGSFSVEPAQRDAFYDSTFAYLSGLGMPVL